MLYYKVKALYDGARVTNKKGKYYTFLVENELYTKKEYNKLLGYTGVHPLQFNPVEINKFKTYTFFGARFEEGVKHSWA